MRTGRRQVLAGMAAAVVTGCTREPHSPAPPSSASSASRPAARPPIAAGGAAAGAKPGVELWSWFDLPVEARSRELSGLAWDGSRRILWAVQDHRPAVVALLPDPDLKTWKLGEEVLLNVPGATQLDLEGIVLLPDGFLLSSEVGPRIIEVDRRGKYVRDLEFPARFKEARHNKSFESLTMSPSGRRVFTTTEVALPRDGPVPTIGAGTRVRIMAFAVEDGRVGAVVSEHVYETDPLPVTNSSLGIADMAAISDDELLVLERSWAPERGNRVRLYRIRLDKRSSCLGVDVLPQEVPSLAKELRVDVASLKAVGLPPAKQVQANPLLDNFEGVAIGPSLPDRRRAVFLVSDDNGHDVQFARLCVLAFPEGL